MRAIEERKKRRRIVRPEHEEKGSEAATPTTIDPTHGLDFHGH